MISYFLTGNWFEAEGFRFLYFSIGCIGATLAAQAWGFFVGSTFPLKVIEHYLLQLVTVRLIMILKISSPPYLLDQFCWCSLVYLVFVRHTVKLQNYFDGCGTLVTSGPVFIPHSTPCTASIVQICHAQTTLSIVTFKNPEYFCKRWISNTLTRLITQFLYLVLLCSCTV